MTDWQFVLLWTGLVGLFVIFVFIILVLWVISMIVGMLNK